MPCDYGVNSFKLCKCAEKWQCACLVRRKKKSRPPFNSTLERDGKAGLHPHIHSQTTNSPAVATYHPKEVKCDIDRSRWDRELETKYFSATLGGRLTGKYARERSLRESGGGPGASDVLRWPENVQEKDPTLVRQDVGFGISQRFKPPKSITPGPGYTLRTHNPYFYVEQAKFKGRSKVPSFGVVPRFVDRKKVSSLPCNRYDVKDPRSIDSYLRKTTGKRGPYDLFTGPRDNTTIRGYMAFPKFQDCKNWPRYLPGGLEQNLLHKSNYFKGRWTNCPRFLKKPVVRMMLEDISTCYRDPNYPGPGHYNPQSPRKPQNAKNYPFNICVEHVRPFPPAGIRPGPGRYKMKEKRRITGNGWTWIFKSKVQREIPGFTPVIYSSF